MCMDETEMFQCLSRTVMDKLKRMVARINLCPDTRFISNTRKNSVLPVASFN